MLQASTAKNSPDTVAADFRGTDRLRYLRALEQKVLWLAMWMIHNANHLRPRRDGMKVGGHQASSASVATIMTALYFDALRTGDRVAVKPHASPIYHAIQYLFGRQTRENLERFRAFGGAQSYPSRTKDTDGVDFSTGSMGLGVAVVNFAALVQDYLRLRDLANRETPAARMIALVGDAELEEGNVFEAMLETWKHDVRNIWWIIDYNRQSLDAVVPDRFAQRLDQMFHATEWRVITLKYGKLLQRAFMRPGGDILRQWIDACPNSLYSALAYKGGAAWRQRITTDLGEVTAIRDLLDEYDDHALHELMTNLAGHDLETIVEAFRTVDDDRPACFVMYTIKGYRLPFAGHKDNHASLMTGDQMTAFKKTMNIADGEEWERFAGLEPSPEELQQFIDSAPFAVSVEPCQPAIHIPIPPNLEVPGGNRISTQEAFGRLLTTIGRAHPEVANRIVTTSPDVTVSTNLAGWVNQRGIFARQEYLDHSRQENILSPLRWTTGPNGQHIELGICENNLFILLAVLGLSHELFGTRLLPIGTVYDPFICRGLDALNYACYQDARFILVATPSGVTLSPEGGAHQSIYTPLIGMGQPGLMMFEPAYADELAEILRWSLGHIQSPDGGAVYLRLSTRPVEQPARTWTTQLKSDVLNGGYWLVPPGKEAELAIVACGAVVPEAIEAHKKIAEDRPDTGLLVITSPSRLHHEWIKHGRDGWKESSSEDAHVESLLAQLPPKAALITVLDGHPATLSWLGAVSPHRIVALGCDRFGQSGDIPDLYREYGLDASAIIGAAARLLTRARTPHLPSG
jgi:pyruvate dehydrogenase E1 component